MSSNLSLTETENKYLKVIYRKQFENSEKANTSSLAKFLNVKPATVTETLQKMAQKNVLKYERYKGVHLTETGIFKARNLLRKHRLLEFLFFEMFNYAPEESCKEASKIDYLVSKKLVDSICKTYNHPKTCPCDKKIYPSPKCGD